MKFRALRIVRISRVVSDLDRAEAFYRDALGFRTVSRGPADKAALFALGCDGAAEEAAMRLGTAEVALVCFATTGKPYPADSRGDDLWFQHLAIVVADMDAAYAHLTRIASWQPISDDGPQLLPLSNGGVRAFKFRDPDGHPLELIWFPDRAGEPGIDHSALAVSSTTSSVRFYRGLGFRPVNRSLNHGPAQDRLDGLPEAHVQVTSLRPETDDGVGLELLGYSPAGRSAEPAALNDLVTDWVTIEVATLFGSSRRAVTDPDGHRLLLRDQGSWVPA